MFSDSLQRSLIFEIAESLKNVLMFILEKEKIRREPVSAMKKVSMDSQTSISFLVIVKTTKQTIQEPMDVDDDLFAISDVGEVEVKLGNIEAPGKTVKVEVGF